MEHLDILNTNLKMFAVRHCYVNRGTINLAKSIYAKENKEKEKVISLATPKEENIMFGQSSYT